MLDSGVGTNSSRNNAVATDVSDGPDGTTTGILEAMVLSDQQVNLSRCYSLISSHSYLYAAHDVEEMRMSEELAMSKKVYAAHAVEEMGMSEELGISKKVYAVHDAEGMGNPLKR